MKTFGAIFVEVGVDPDLGLLRLRRAVGAYSAGRIINPRTAHAQMTGGFIWGWGMAAMEATRHEPTLGRWEAKNLSNVALPVNADNQMVGAMLLLSGVGLLSGHGLAGPEQSHFLIGDEMFAVSGVAMGAFTYLLRRWSLHPVEALSGMSLLSLVILLPFLPVLFGNPIERHGAGPFLLQVGMQGAIGGLVAMLAYITAVRFLGAVRAAYFPGFVPGVTVMCAGMLGLEPIGFVTIIGVSLATTGLIVAQLTQPVGKHSVRDKAHEI